MSTKPSENPTPVSQPVAEPKPVEEPALDISFIDVAEDTDDAIFDDHEGFDKALEHFGEDGVDDFLTKEDVERVRVDEAKWIQKAIKNPGGLHRALGVPSGEPIPLGKIRTAAKSKGKLGRMARLAMTLRGLRRKRESVKPPEVAESPSVSEQIMSAIKQGFEDVKAKFSPVVTVTESVNVPTATVVVPTVPVAPTPVVETITVTVSDNTGGSSVSIPEPEKVVEEKKEETTTLSATNKVEEAGKGVVEVDTPNEALEMDYKTVIARRLKESKGMLERGALVRTRMAGGKVFETNEYTAANAGSAIPEIWAADVLLLTETQGLLDKVVVHYPDIKGKPGDTVHIPTLGTVTFAAGVEYTEATGQAPTTSSVPCVVVERVAEVKFDKKVMEDAVPSLISRINTAIAQGYEWDFDAQVLGWLNTPAAAAPIKGTLVEAGLMKATLIATLCGSFRAGTQEPHWLIIHPVQEASLLKDSQFTNAATYGDATVIRSGRIYTYLGLNVVVTPQVYSTGGTYKAFLLTDTALAVADKRTFEIEQYYFPPERKQYFVASGRYGGTIVNPGAVWMCTTVNG